MPCQTSSPLSQLIFNIYLDIELKESPDYIYIGFERIEGANERFQKFGKSSREGKNVIDKASRGCGRCWIFPHFAQLGGYSLPVVRLRCV